MSAIDATSFRAAESGLERFDEQLAGVAEATLERMADAAAEGVRAARRRHHVTGKGERLVSVRSSGAGTRRTLRVHAGGRVAHLLTGGTRPHPIRALEGRALRLAGSTRPFAAAVRHPGTRADPFVARGVAAARPDIDRLVAGAADELVADLAADMRS